MSSDEVRIISDELRLLNTVRQLQPGMVPLWELFCGKYETFVELTQGGVV